MDLAVTGKCCKPAFWNPLVWMCFPCCVQCLCCLSESPVLRIGFSSGSRAFPLCPFRTRGLCLFLQFTVRALIKCFSCPWGSLFPSVDDSWFSVVNCILLRSRVGLVFLTARVYTSIWKRQNTSINVTFNILLFFYLAHLGICLGFEDCGEFLAFQILTASPQNFYVNHASFSKYLFWI